MFWWKTKQHKNKGGGRGNWMKLINIINETKVYKLTFWRFLYYSQDPCWRCLCDEKNITLMQQHNYGIMTLFFL